VSQAVGICILPGYTAYVNNVLWYSNTQNTLTWNPSDLHFTNPYTGTPAFAADPQGPSLARPVRRH